MLRMEYVTIIPPPKFLTALLKAITSRSWLKPRWGTRSAHESLINSSRRPPTGVHSRSPFLFGCWADELGRLPDPTSINAAYQKNAVPINVSAPSALRKDRRIEPAVGARSVRP